MRVRFTIFPVGVRTHGPLITELSRYADTRFLDDRRDFAKPPHRHPPRGPAYAETRVHVARVVPDRRRHATNLRLVFLQVKRIPTAAHAIDLLLQLLGTANRVC